jgi:hypothetical protein
MTIRPTIDHVDAMYRTDFASFTGKCFSSLAPGSQFMMSWHIEAIAHHLELVRRGKIKRLIINLPPRSLKSMLASVAFPAFVLGHDPAKRLIVISYGVDLSIKHTNDFRQIVSHPFYQRLFPRMRLSRKKNTELEVVTTQNGYRLATSVDGNLMGRGGDFIIVDDPLKAIDALSQSKRERVNQSFAPGVLPRLDDKRTGAIIVVMQRLHTDDLTGWVLRHPDEWVVLSLPAIAEQDEAVQLGPDRYHHRCSGDVLHPEREPREVLESLRAQLGPETFAAQFHRRRCRRTI